VNHGQPRSHGPPAYRVRRVGRHSPKPARPPIHFPTAEAFRPVSRLSAAIPHAASRRTTAPRASASLSRTDVTEGVVKGCGWHGMQGIRQSVRFRQRQAAETSRSATVAGEVPVDRGMAAPKGLGDLRHCVLPAAAHLLGRLDVVAVNAEGRPPWRPRAWAAASPAAARSRMRSRPTRQSGEHLEDKLAAGVVLSIASCRTTGQAPKSPCV